MRTQQPDSAIAKRGSLIIALMAMVIATPSLACQIPVFRYALERWQADHYDIVILHEAPLNEAERGSLKALKAANFESPSAANFDVRPLAAKDISDARLQQAWKTRTSKTEPLMIVQYPAGTKDVPDRVAMEAPFNSDSVAQIAESPKRKEIARRLLEGQSTVWIFVPSGHVRQDAAALETLKEQVAINESQLELPEQEDIESEEDLQVASHLELRIEFSIITLKRDDPKEQLLLSSLLRSESDLLELDEPMAFPVLGRGRVLYALVGKGISSSTIGAVSRFMVGPCSCQVKNQNPGFDLLLACDWDNQLFGKDGPRPPKDETKKPVRLKIPSGKSKP